MITIRSWKRVKKVIAVQDEEVQFKFKTQKKCSRYLCKERSLIHVSAT